MRRIKTIFSSLMLILILALTTGCQFTMFRGFEKTINIRFMCEGEEIATASVTQFKNAYVPNLPKAYIYTDYEFFGWTAYDVNSISNLDTDKYIESGALVHYNDVEAFAKDGVVELEAFQLPPEKIEIIIYYLVIGWYSKTTTSGLGEDQFNNWFSDLKAYLKSKGVSDEDINNIDVRAYDADVATTGALVNKQGDVDIMVGMGGNFSADAENSLGNVKCLERISGVPMGPKERYIDRLSDDEVTMMVWEWIKTPEGVKSLA